jgi:nitroreductase
VRVGEEDGSYSIYQPFCIACSHCGIICPVDAVVADEGQFPTWKNPDLDPEAIRTFIQGKRSVRRYSETPISQGFLDSLLYTGSLTSTASNRQEWRASVLTGAAVRSLAGQVIGYYAGLLKLAKNPVMKFILRFTEARRYVKSPESFKRFEHFINSFHEGGDPLFFHAPAVVILSASKKEKRFGNTDCVLAGSAMMYTAAAYGIGSCMIGFAQVAMNMRKAVKEAGGVDREDTVHLVFTLGYHDRPYRRLPIRKSMPVVFEE